MTQYTTTNYGIAYADDLEPLKSYPAITAQVAATVDAALTAGGIAPPNAADLVAVAGRVTSLEGSRTTDEAAIAANAAAITTRQAFPVALLRLNTQSTADIAAGVNLVPFDVADIDTAGGYNKFRTGGGATSDTRWTVPAGQGGTYDVQGSAPLLGTGGANLADAQVAVVYVLKNGTPIMGASNVETNGKVDTLHPSSQLVPVVLVPGDYLELRTYCSAAYRYRVTTADGLSPSLSIRRIR